jgi:hypothetical protein
MNRRRPTPEKRIHISKPDDFVETTVVAFCLLLFLLFACWLEDEIE